MTSTSPLKCRSLALVVTALAGCAAGPDFKRPAAPLTARYTPDALPAQTDSAAIPLGNAQRFVEGRDLAADWWTLFHCEPLNSLVTSALQANPDLQAAEAALKAAHEATLAQKGAYFPTVGANLNRTRQSDSSLDVDPVFSVYTAQLTVSYAPDVFGLNRRRVEVLASAEDGQRYAREAAYVTLTTNIVAAAIQEASLRAQIDATREIVQLAKLELEIMQHEMQAGQASLADVALQEATVARFEAGLPPLEGALALQRHLITILAGRPPSDDLAQRFELASLDLPEELPVSLPSRIVEQRPDVLAAGAQLHAASAQVGIAVANRLPVFTLSAALGSAAPEFSKLLTPGTGFWTAGADVAHTLFAGGSLLHTQRAAEAAYVQAEAQYRSTVLAALQSVADALSTIQYDASVLKASDAAEKAADKSLKIARQQWRAGLIGYPDVQAAELAYQQALLALITAQASRLTDTALLFQALGGGWWNRPVADTAAAAQPKL
jgi:NodT family efflux transporter outer membrane factor (OMF) lipoprotein